MTKIGNPIIQKTICPITLFILFIFAINPHISADACYTYCAPTTATICVGADDQSTVWINGNPIGSVGNPCVVEGSSVQCLSVPVTDLATTGTNYIQISNLNVTAGYVWSSWLLDITCAGGTHEYISSSDGNTSYYNQVTSGASPPPNDTNGYTWYNPAYSNTTGWGVPTPVTNPASIYCSPAIDPRTGTYLVPLGYSASSGDEPGQSDEAPAGEVLYFRQGFNFCQLTPMTPNPQSPTDTVTPTNTPVASITMTKTPTFTPTSTPVMDVTKTVNKSTAMVGDTVTFTLTYNNIGTVIAVNVPLWDTIPNCVSYAGSNPAATLSGGVLSWNLGNINPGGNGSVTWWGVISCYPYNPFFARKYYFALMYEKSFIGADIEKGDMFCKDQ